MEPRATLGALAGSYAVLDTPSEPSIVVMLVTPTLRRKRTKVVPGYLDARCSNNAASSRLGASPPAANSLPSAIARWMSNTASSAARTLAIRLVAKASPRGENGVTVQGA